MSKIFNFSALGLTTVNNRRLEAISYYGGKRQLKIESPAQVISMSEEHDHSHYHGVDKAEEHLSVDEAVKMLLDNIVPVKPETISALKANNRVLFDDIKSPIYLPRRARSTRDGYAVSITEDAESGRNFKITGDVRIGIIPKFTVKNGEAVRVATGSYIPNGANAVVMIEYAEVQDKELRANKAIKVHENILNPGEDLTKGQLLFTKGCRIHPQHVALFSMLGIRKVRVFSKPKIAFFSTGDELVDSSKANSRKAVTGVYDATRPFIGFDDF